MKKIFLSLVFLFGVGTFVMADDTMKVKNDTVAVEDGFKNIDLKEVPQSVKDAIAKKYERYKPFTGLDEPVIRFLEEDGEIFPFLNAAYSLVDASVKRYMERGFSNLSVCFGCTGGQHRSVYSAQHMAEHINKKFGVKVELIHREQNIEQTFERTL